MPSLKNKVIHEGIIKKIEGSTIKVSFEAHSACAGCNAQSICSLSDSEEKIIEISDNRPFNIGEKIHIIFSTENGLRATFFAYILPFIIMFTCLIGSSLLFKNELVIGIFSLSVLIPYFFLISRMDRFFKRKFSFYIEKITK